MTTGRRRDSRHRAVATNSTEHVFVPDAMTFSLMEAVLGNLVTGGPALRMGFPAVVTPFHMGMALGIARHALDEITAQAVQKGRNFQLCPLSTHPQFQFALGKAELELGAARALALQILSRIWDRARFEEYDAGRCFERAKIFDEALD